MSWAIVKFPEEGDKVEAVPTSWICGDYCYWPPSETPQNVARALKTCWSPNKKTWDQCKIQVLSYKSYDKFTIACSKATKARCRSDIDTSDSELPSKRPRKINTKLISSDDGERTDGSESGGEEILSLQTPTLFRNDSQRLNMANNEHETPCLTLNSEDNFRPRLKVMNNKSQPFGEKTIMNSKSVTPMTTERGLSSHYQTTSISSPTPINIFSSTPLRHVEETTERVPTTIVSENKMEKLIQLVLKNNTLLKQQARHIDDLEKKLDLLLNKTSTATRENRSDIEHNVQKVKEILTSFPIKTDTDLEEIEHLLTFTTKEDEKEKEELRVQLAKNLSMEGSTNYKEAVRRILSEILSDTVAVLYSYKGHKGKKKLCEKKMVCRLIIDAVLLCTKTDKEPAIKKSIEAEISTWLSKASQRLHKNNNKIDN